MGSPMFGEGTERPQHPNLPSKLYAYVVNFHVYHVYLINKKIENKTLTK